MLLFRSEEHVNRWGKDRNLRRRPILSLQQLWQMALAWYENRLTVESRRPGAAEITEIFGRLGLSDPFWNPFA